MSEKGQTKRKTGGIDLIIASRMEGDSGVEMLNIVVWGAGLVGVVGAAVRAWEGEGLGTCNGAEVNESCCHVSVLCGSSHNHGTDLVLSLRRRCARRWDECLLWF